MTNLSLDSYYSDFDNCNLRFAGYNTRTGQYLANDGKMLEAMEQIVAAGQLSVKGIADDAEEYRIYSEKTGILPDPDPQVERSEDGRLLSRVIQWDINDNLFIAGVISPLVARDSYYRQSRLFNLVYSTRTLAPILFVVCAFASVADLIFLCCAAGHRRGRENITPNLQDRIPLDLYLFGMFWLGLGCLLLIAELSYSIDLFCAVAMTGLGVFFFLLCLAAC